MNKVTRNVASVVGEVKDVVNVVCISATEHW